MFRKERGFIPHLKKGAGFTLIELLIVIAVIGILAAAILPRFISFDTDAKIASTKGSLSSLRAASVMRRSKVESYVNTIGELVATYITKIPVAQKPIVSTACAEVATVGAIVGTAGGPGGWALVTSGAGDGEIYVNCTGTADYTGTYYTNY